MISVWPFEDKNFLFSFEANPTEYFALFISQFLNGLYIYFLQSSLFVGWSMVCFFGCLEADRRYCELLSAGKPQIVGLLMRARVKC